MAATLPLSFPLICGHARQPVQTMLSSTPSLTLSGLSVSDPFIVPWDLMSNLPDSVLDPVSNADIRHRVNEKEGLICGRFRDSRE